MPKLLTRSGNKHFLFLFSPSKAGTRPMIATSMALLSTGADLDKETDQIQRGLVEAALSGEREASSSVQSTNVQVLDGDLLLDSTGLLLDHQPNPIGNFSPVYSPLSTASADSGVGGSGGLATPENDTFLAELFGSNFPLLSQPSPPSVYGPNGSLVSVDNFNARLVSTAAYSKPMLSEQHQSSFVDANTSESFGEQPAEKNRKNAEAARQNRLKKKKYLEELEKDRADVKRENVVLKTKCHEYQQRCQRLQAEVEYLKSVIANESMLSSLIQNIPDIPNVRLSSSFSSRKRPHTTTSSKDGTPASKRSKSSKDTTSGGICLHVANDLVSIEFCQHCSKQAATQS